MPDTEGNEGTGTLANRCSWQFWVWKLFRFVGVWQLGYRLFKKHKLPWLSATWFALGFKTKLYSKREQRDMKGKMSDMTIAREYDPDDDIPDSVYNAHYDCGDKD